MSLNNRKLQILNAIITEYISSNEPIASRTIAKRYDIGVSSATIRNEMSDLEEMGLILQPHTSSGRIPSDKGYRIYVNEILRNDNKNINFDTLSQIINKNICNIEYLMQETAKLISSYTNCVSIISEPKVQDMKIKHIQLVPIDKNSILLVMVLDNAIVKNKVVEINLDCTYEDLNELSIMLTKVFKGKQIDEVTKEEVDSIRNQLNDDSNVLIPVLNAIVAEFTENKNYDVYTSGTDKIYNYPEFSDSQKAIQVLKALEQENILLTMLGETNDDSVQIVIGSENTVDAMKNLSLVKGTYRLGSAQGCIGVIGPTRMEYSNAINTVNSVTQLLEKIIKESRE